MKLLLDIHGQLRQVEVDHTGPNGQWRVQVEGESILADARLIRPGVLSLLIAGQSHRIVLDQQPGEAALYISGRTISWQIEDPRSLRRRRRVAGANGPIALKASMPGRVIRVLLETGDPVAAHQGILVVEAMKMQNELKAPREGRLAELRVEPGETVASGQVLAVIE